MQEKFYLLACHRYIEVNPIRAGMVEYPAQYCWSSYRANAQGEASVLVCPHTLYQALGRDEVLRAKAYRELFRYQLDPGMVDQIRAATNGKYVLVSTKFSAEVEAVLGRRVT